MAMSGRRSRKGVMVIRGLFTAIRVFIFFWLIFRSSRVGGTEGRWPKGKANPQINLTLLNLCLAQ